MKKIFSKAFLLSSITSTLLATEITPEKNLNKVLKDFEEYAIQAKKDWNVPGMALSIVKDDQMIYANAFGVKEVNTEHKVDTHTIFQIGSISKSFTSALTAMLVDDKKLNWNDKVIDHFPEFLMHDPWVTREFEVQDTMAQRSGLEAYSLDALSFIGYKRGDIIHALRYVHPITSFRSSYAYQNCLFLVAAELLHQKSGKTWEELLQERILSPLGMKDTTADSASFLKAPNHAWLHERQPDGSPKPQAKPFRNIEWTYEYGPAGGINSNALDMAKYAILQMNNGKFEGKQLISEESVKRMHRPQILVNDANGLTTFYGLGWATTTSYRPYPIVWHSGGTSGFAAFIAFIPEDKIGIVILTNEAGTNLTLALAFQFFDLYYGKQGTDWSKKLLEGKLLEEKALTEKINQKPVDFTPGLPLDRYAGKYHSPIYGEAEISVDGNDLVLILGPAKEKIRLSHFNRDTFSIFWEGMDELGINKASFTVDKEGIPATLSADVFSKNEENAFKRVVKSN